MHLKLGLVAMIMFDKFLKLALTGTCCHHHVNDAFIDLSVYPLTGERVRYIAACNTS